MTGVKYKGFKISLQFEAVVIEQVERLGQVTESDVVQKSDVFLDNWLKKCNNKEQSGRASVQTAIQRLVERGALQKNDSLGKAYIYSKGEHFNPVAKEVLEQLFEVIDFYDDNEGASNGHDWVISWREEEIYFNFDSLEKFVEMLRELNQNK